MSDEFGVFCPGCGAEVRCEPKEGTPLGMHHYEGYCVECDEPIILEDRRSFRGVGQKGVTIIEFQ